MKFEVEGYEILHMLVFVREENTRENVRGLTSQDLRLRRMDFSPIRIRMAREGIEVGGDAVPSNEIQLIGIPNSNTR
jgi:hypothetical protein